VSVGYTNHPWSRPRTCRSSSKVLFHRVDEVAKEVCRALVVLVRYDIRVEYLHVHPMSKSKKHKTSPFTRHGPESSRCIACLPQFPPAETEESWKEITTSMETGQKTYPSGILAGGRHFALSGRVQIVPGRYALLRESAKVNPSTGGLVLRHLTLAAEREAKQ
jgi:hypothetical protein